MHAHRKIELQPSARLAQTGLAGQHNETEQERRRGAALIHLSTYRAHAGDPRPFSCSHLFLGVKSPNSKDKPGTGAVNAFKIYYT